MDSMMVGNQWSSNYKEQKFVQVVLEKKTKYLHQF
jgi:hypothetical protein